MGNKLLIIVMAAVLIIPQEPLALRRVRDTLRPMAAVTSSVVSPSDIAGRARVREIEGLKDLKPKSAIFALDWNIPRDKTKLGNDQRIRESLLTISKMFEYSDFLYVLTHSGRPEGDRFEEEYSLDPIVDRAKMLFEEAGIKARVVLLDYDLDEAARIIQETKASYPNEKIVFVFENIRFYEEERSDNSAERLNFERRLINITNATVYVNEAFDKCHRGEEASMEMVTLFDEDKRAAGIDLSDKIQQFMQFFEQAEHPWILVCGGAKFDKYDKLAEIAVKKLTNVDTMFIVGALALAWLKAGGEEVGESKVPSKEKEVKIVSEAMRKIKEAQQATGFSYAVTEDHILDTDPRVSRASIGKHTKALDIGETTKNKITHLIRGLKQGAVIINGGAGMFEDERFDKGTMELLIACSEAAERGVTVLAIGSDMNNAIKIASEKGIEISDKILRITGGGVIFDILHKGIEGLLPIRNLIREARRAETSVQVEKSDVDTPPILPNKGSDAKADSAGEAAHRLITVLEVISHAA